MQNVRYIIEINGQSITLIYDKSDPMITMRMGKMIDDDFVEINKNDFTTFRHAINQIDDCIQQQKWKDDEAKQHQHMFKACTVKEAEDYGFVNSPK